MHKRAEHEIPLKAMEHSSDVITFAITALSPSG